MGKENRRETRRTKDNKNTGKPLQQTESHLSPQALPHAEPTDARGNGAKGSRLGYLAWTNPEAEFVPIEDQSVADILRNRVKNEGTIPIVSSEDPYRQLQQQMNERSARFQQNYGGSEDN